MGTGTSSTARLCRGQGRRSWGGRGATTPASSSRSVRSAPTCECHLYFSRRRPPTPYALRRPPSVRSPKHSVAVSRNDSNITTISHIGSSVATALDL